MTSQANYIETKLPEGYTLLNEVNHKSSYYFYISNQKFANNIVARISDHDAICANSRAHIQVLRECGYIQLDIEVVENAIEEISAELGMEISEDEIYEMDNFSVKLEIGDWKREEEIIAAYIVSKLFSVNILNVY